MQRAWRELGAALALTGCVPCGAAAAEAGAHPASVRVRVTGHAAADNPDRANAARLDAMRAAIREAGGAQVRAHSVARFGELVSQFTYVRANGLVGAMQPAGPPAVAGDLYAQDFLVEVRVDALNRDLVTEKIDVAFLYDVVRRPRIAVCVADLWNPTGDPGRPLAADPDQSSNQQIVAEFKRRHDGFVFKELNLLRAAAGEEADYVREARRNNFDLLILGTTRTNLVRGAAPPPRPETALNGAPSAAGGQPDTLAKLRALAPPAAAEGPAFGVMLDWRAINVSTAETVLALSGDRPAVAGDARDPAAASRAAKLALLEPRIAELFRELIGYWNQRAFGESYELTFRTNGEPGPLAIERTLGERGGFVADSVVLAGATAGRVVFTATATLSRAEVAQNLAQAFGPALAVSAIRPGAIELEPAGASAVRAVAVTIAGLSLTDTLAVQSALAGVAGVSAVHRQPFAGGKVTLLVTTTLADEALGVAVEAALPGRLRVTGLGPGGVEAVAN